MPSDKCRDLVEALERVMEDHKDRINTRIGTTGQVARALAAHKAHDQVEEAREKVVEAAKVWRTHHVCCPKDCPDLKDAQKGLGDALDNLAKAREAGR